MSITSSTAITQTLVQPTLSAGITGIGSTPSVLRPLQGWTGAVSCGNTVFSNVTHNGENVTHLGETVGHAG